MANVSTGCAVVEDDYYFDSNEGDDGDDDLNGDSYDYNVNDETKKRNDPC